MEGGFRFLLGGIVLIALAFSLVSVWPALTEPKPRQAPGQVQPVVPTIPTPRAGVLPGGSNQPAHPNAANPQRSQSIQQQANPLPLVAAASPVSLELPDARNWVYTRKRVTLFKAPGGDPHRAFSINHAELEIMGGTRLMRVRSEDGWLLVKSPSRLYGWLRETDVSTRPPVHKDTKWSLYPPE